MSSTAQITDRASTSERSNRHVLDLKVESRTLGTNAAYNFSTKNVSRSGLLLVWDRAVAFMPFIENTLLELVIDPAGDHLVAPVNCLGKVIRKDSRQLKNKRIDVIGVQIVQIDSSDMELWDKCLAELEKYHGLELSQDIPGVGAAKSSKKHR